jgi:formylglycine-generating enzyme required for sulfatase activity
MHDELKLVVVTLLLLFTACGGGEDQSADSGVDADANLGADTATDADTEPPPNPAGLVWIAVPAGSFEMGCSPGDADCADDEEPRHTVTLDAFEMLETEVTTTQYAVFLNDQGNDCNGQVCVDVNADDLHLVEVDGEWSVEEDYQQHPQAWVSG